MSSFVYDIPTKVYFGEGVIENNLSNEIKKYGNSVLLVYSGDTIKRIGLYDKLIKELSDNGITVYEYSGVEPNPRHTAINEASKICRDNDVDVVLAVGGGSVIDSSKAISAGKYYDGDIWDLVLKKSSIEKTMPLVTVLTIAASGSEMNNNAIISNKDKEFLAKKGLKSDLFWPKASFLDPTITYSVNKYQTACGSFDILSHILETYFARNNGLDMLDKMMESLMKTVIECAIIAYHDPENYEARANLMWASSWAINGFFRIDKLPNTWVCHLLEHQLSAFYDITHGLGLAILTPKYLRAVLNENTVDRFYRFGVNVWGIDGSLPKMEVAEKSIECLEHFIYQELELADNLSSLNIDDSNFEEMAKRICSKGPVKGFIDMDEAEIVKIFKKCL